jgi:phosphoribosylformimino-5-aminoimidazole carboxamide ribotide isomerase
VSIITNIKETNTVNRGFILPAIDIIEGKAVRLTHGDYNSKKVYYNDPLEAAKAFEGAGLTGLHLVDLDGAKAGKIVNIKVLDTIANHTSLQIDFGGGVQQEQDVVDIINAGACMVTIGSLAVKQASLLEEWVLKFGSNRFFIGADVRDEQITVSGWLEKTDVNVFDFIAEYNALGVRHFFCTDVAKDGMLEGPSTNLYQKIIHRFPQINLVASGGVSSLDDLMALQEINCAGAIVGKALYENRITLESLKPFQHAG